ncbi:MAG: hypothetical protein ACOC0P_01945, partial [Planctomycetota bacterium]
MTTGPAATAEPPGDGLLQDSTQVALPAVSLDAPGMLLWLIPALVLVLAILPVQREAKLDGRSVKRTTAGPARSGDAAGQSSRAWLIRIPRLTLRDPAPPEEAENVICFPPAALVRHLQTSSAEGAGDSRASSMPEDPASNRSAPHPDAGPGRIWKRLLTWLSSVLTLVRHQTRVHLSRIRVVMLHFGSRANSNDHAQRNAHTASFPWRLLLILVLLVSAFSRPTITFSDRDDASALTAALPAGPPGEITSSTETGATTPSGTTARRTTANQRDPHVQHDIVWAIDRSASMHRTLGSIERALFDDAVAIVRDAVASDALELSVPDQIDREETGWLAGAATDAIADTHQPHLIAIAATDGLAPLVPRPTTSSSALVAALQQADRSASDSAVFGGHADLNDAVLRALQLPRSTTHPTAKPSAHPGHAALENEHHHRTVIVLSDGQASSWPMIGRTEDDDARANDDAADVSTNQSDDSHRQRVKRQRIPINVDSFTIHVVDVTNGSSVQHLTGAAIKHRKVQGRH